MLHYVCQINSISYELRMSNHSPPLLEEAQWRHCHIRGNATKLNCCLFIFLLKLVHSLYCKTQSCCCLTLNKLQPLWAWVCVPGSHVCTTFTVTILRVINPFFFFQQTTTAPSSLVSITGKMLSFKFEKGNVFLISIYYLHLKFIISPFKYCCVYTFFVRRKM